MRPNRLGAPSRNRDLHVLPRRQRIDRGAHVGQVPLDARLARLGQYRNGDTPPRQVLLVLEVLIRCDQGLEPGGLRPSKQLTVRQRAPTEIDYCGHVVLEVAAKRGWGSLIEEYAHSRHLQRARRVLQNQAYLVCRYARKPAHEIGDVRAVF